MKMISIQIMWGLIEEPAQYIELVQVLGSAK